MAKLGLRAPNIAGAQTNAVLRHTRQLAASAGDRLDEAECETSHGLLLLATRSSDAARKRFESARELAAEVGALYGQIAADSGLCDFWLSHSPAAPAESSEEDLQELRLQNARRAVEIQSRILDMLSRLGNVVAEVPAANKLALMHEGLDESEKALEVHRRTLAAAQKTGSLRNQATAWMFLGRWYQRQERWADALDATSRCLTLVPENAKPPIHITLAEIYAAMSATREAIAEYEAAREALESTDLLNLLRCLRGTAELQWEIGQHDDAIGNLSEALDVAQALQLPEEQSIRDLLADWKRATP